MALNVFIIATGQVNSPYAIVAMIFFIMPTFFIFTSVGRTIMSIVTINEDGVKVTGAFKKLGSIKWSDMAEVGIGTHNDAVMAYTWIYFSKESLTDKEIVNMGGFLQNNNRIKIRFSKKAIKVVQKYYYGKIKNLSEDIKGHFLL